LLLFVSIDVFLARHYLHGSSNGVYVASGTLSRAALLLPQSLCAVALARFSVARASSPDYENRWHRLRDTVMISALVCSVAACGLALVGPAVLRGAFGIDRPESGTVLIWLAACAIPTSVTLVLSTYYLARRSVLVYSPWLGALLQVAAIVMWHGSAGSIARAAFFGVLAHATVTAALLRRERGTLLAAEARDHLPTRAATRLRILVLSWRDLAHPSAGGAEVYVEEIARRWVASGHSTTIFCAAVAGQPGHEIVHGVEIVRRGGRVGVYRQAARFWRTQGRGRYDLVIDCINTKPFDAIRFVREVPVVALAHQVAREVWWYEAPLPAAIVGRFLLEPMWLARYRDTPVLTVSASSRSALARYGIDRLDIVPEGVALPTDVRPAKATSPTIVFCGRLVRSKRPDHAVAAFARLRDVLPDARLVVIGSGPMERRLRRRAPEGVEFVGRVPTTTRNALMASAHALVVTSVREGWGLVVSEAAALGTPTVAYDVPGLRDSVTAAAGRLTAAEPRALAAALAEHLPGWIDRPPAPIPWGGARSWDDVAETVLTTAANAAGLEVVASDCSAARVPWARRRPDRGLASVEPAFVHAAPSSAVPGSGRP
jgi:glycosyltransferase involved in cell wall biosynthesis